MVYYRRLVKTAVSTSGRSDTFARRLISETEHLSLVRRVFRALPDPLPEAAAIRAAFRADPEYKTLAGRNADQVMKLIIARCATTAGESPKRSRTWSTGLDFAYGEETFRELNRQMRQLGFSGPKGPTSCGRSASTTSIRSSARKWPCRFPATTSGPSSATTPTPPSRMSAPIEKLNESLVLRQRAQ